MGSLGMAKRQAAAVPPRRRHVPSTTPYAAGLTVLVVALLLVGLLMVYSASYARAYEQTGDPNFFLKRQLVAAVAGLIVFVVCALVPAQRWMSVDVLLLGVSVVLVLATLIPGVAVGSRWIRLGPMNVQPTELLKVALIIYVAASLCRRRQRVREFSQGVWPHLLVAAGAAMLSIKQPDFGMALMFLSITYFLLFLGGTRFKHLLVTILAALPPLVLLMVAAPYRRARLLSFLDPFGDAANGGYQTIQSLVSLGSGGVWGRGLGGSVEKLGYLPAAHTDFIFSVVGEELGIVGTLTIVVGFILLGYLGFRIAVQAADRFSALVAAGITFTLCLQALLNVGVAVGLLPVTGLTLPFISYGGSSLLASLAMAGILVSIGRDAVRGGAHDQRAGLRRR